MISDGIDRLQGKKHKPTSTDPASEVLVIKWNGKIRKLLPETIDMAFHKTVIREEAKIDPAVRRKQILSAQ
jgi:hypothetical protein